MTKFYNSILILTCCLCFTLIFGSAVSAGTQIQNASQDINQAISFNNGAISFPGNGSNSSSVSINNGGNTQIQNASQQINQSIQFGQIPQQTAHRIVIGVKNHNPHPYPTYNFHNTVNVYYAKLLGFAYGDCVLAGYNFFNNCFEHCTPPKPHPVPPTPPTPPVPPTPKPCEPVKCPDGHGRYTIEFGKPENGCKVVCKNPCKDTKCPSGYTGVIPGELCKDKNLCKTPDIHDIKKFCTPVQAVCPPLVHKLCKPGFVRELVTYEETGNGSVKPKTCKKYECVPCPPTHPTPPPTAGPVFCTQDAAFCPATGEFVGRVGPDCRFDCPVPVQR